MTMTMTITEMEHAYPKHLNEYIDHFLNLAAEYEAVVSKYTNESTDFQSGISSIHTFTLNKEYFKAHSIASELITEVHSKRRIVEASIDTNSDEYEDFLFIYMGLCETLHDAFCVTDELMNQ